MEDISSRESNAFWAASLFVLITVLGLAVWAWPEGSALRNPATGSLTDFQAPLMRMIVPLIFLIAIVPGVIYGFMSGTFKSSRDLIGTMTKAMHSMAYYIVMAFFCALFIDAFGKSNIGALLAIK